MVPNDWSAIRALTGDPTVLASLQLAVLVLARIGPIVIFTPIFGGQAVPPTYRFVICIVFVMSIAFAMFRSDAVPVATHTFLLQIVRELLIGISLSLLILVVFESLTAVGALIDLTRGQGSAMILDPHVKQQQSALGVFLMQLGIVLFVTIGGHQIFFRAFANCLVAFEPGMPSGKVLLSLISPGSLIRVSAQVISIAFQLASPVVLMMLLLDVVLGLISRVAPQIQVFFLSLSMKGALALLIVLLVSTTIYDVFQSHVMKMISLIGASGTS